MGCGPEVAGSVYHPRQPQQTPFYEVAYSCRVRCFCPSCHEKRALEKAGWVAEHVCAEVPHRQFVFTIPKRLRIYFRFERRLLGELCRAATRTVITVYRAASGRPDAVPGVIGAIQTFGQLAHWHGNTPASAWTRACAWRRATPKASSA